MGQTYTFTDLKQSLLGSFTTVLFYIVLRAGDQMPFLEQEIGIIFTIMWGYILYQSFNKYNINSFFINYLITFILCIILTIIFQIATWEAIKMNPFGSPAMVFTWLGFPVAILFDKENITNVFKRYYIRK